MMKFYEEFRYGNPTVLCPECGEANPAEDEKCYNCGVELEKQAPLWRNALDTLISPLKGMRRIAATMPWIQGIFVYLAVLSVLTFVQAYAYLSFGNDVVNGSVKLSRTYTQQVINEREGNIPLSQVQRDALNKSDKAELHLTDKQITELNDSENQATRLTEAQYNFLNDNTDTNIKLTESQSLLHKKQLSSTVEIDSSFIVPFLLNQVVRIAFTAVFALAISVTAKLFFKEMAKTNFKSLFAVASYAQIASIVTLILLLSVVVVPDLAKLRFDPGSDQTNPFLMLFQFGALLYQLVLLVIGVKFSTKLSWNRTTIVVLIPALLFVFLLRQAF